MLDSITNKERKTVDSLLTNIKSECKKFLPIPPKYQEFALQSACYGALAVLQELPDEEIDLFMKKFAPLFWTFMQK